MPRVVQSADSGQLGAELRARLLRTTRADLYPGGDQTTVRGTRRRVCGAVAYLPGLRQLGRARPDRAPVPRCDARGGTVAASLLRDLTLRRRPEALGIPRSD